MRPENPPQLRPKFVFVLGTENDETIRNGTMAEVHLRKWSPADFAQAVVIMAMRELLPSEQVQHLTQDVLLAAGVSVSINELKRGH